MGPVLPASPPVYFGLEEKLKGRFKCYTSGCSVLMDEGTAQVQDGEASDR